MVFRVVHSGTGMIGRAALDGILNHPEVELVGMYVHSPEKIGKDVGVFIERDPVGIETTHSWDELLALEPDCLSYMSNSIGREVEAANDVCRFLERGVNAVTASIFAWVLTTTRVTEDIAAWVLGISDNPMVFLLLANLFLLFVGCFMETIAAITILVPVFMPIVAKLGIDPVHFGLVMILNLMIGLLTPPVGMVLFVLQKVARISFEATVRAVLPWLWPLLVTLVLITYFPQLVLWLPNLIYNK